MAIRSSVLTQDDQNGADLDEEREQRQVAPEDAPAPAGDTGAPEPPTPDDTLKADDIAQVAVNAQAPDPVAQYDAPAQAAPAPAAAPALPADQDPNVIALMRQRYGSGSAAGPADGAVKGPGTDMESILQNRLVELMGRSATPSASDPEIAAQLQAMNAAGDRAFGRNAADLAERAAYAGQSGSGAEEAGRAALRQAQGESSQQISAGIFKDAANRRIAELQQTLQTAGSLIDAKQQRAMQLQIAQLQDATDRYGIGEGGRQFDAGLAEKIREYGLDDAARASALGASSSANAANLDNRRYEFDKNYGLDDRAQTLAESKFTQSQNADPVLQWLQQNYGPID